MFLLNRRSLVWLIVSSAVLVPDDLATGRSTFMVEMVETASILNRSSENALVILDEIGRRHSNI